MADDSEKNDPTPTRNTGLVNWPLKPGYRFSYRENEGLVSSIYIVAAQHEPQKCWSLVSDWHLHTLNFPGPIVNVTDCHVLFATEAEVNISPNAFDVSVRYRFVHVRVVSLVIMRREVVAVLPQPDSQCAISHVHVIVGVIPGEP